jgi:hypothetical protein
MHNVQLPKFTEKNVKKCCTKNLSSLASFIDIKISSDESDGKYPGLHPRRGLPGFCLFPA